MKIDTGNMHIRREGLGIAAADMKGCTRDFYAEAAERGRMQALRYIAKCADDGDRLAAIERGGNPIAEIAFRDSCMDVRI